jgi:hypothetical protein
LNWQGSNGMMFYVFLDDNLQTMPNPKGKVKISYYVSGTGSFSASMNF